MEMISCLVPELRSETHHGCGMQVFEKTQCFYVVTVNCNVFVILSCCVKSTRVLVKRQLESWQRQLEKTAVVKVGSYIVSIDKKTTVYKLEACEITFFEMRALAVHSNPLPYFTDLPVSSSL